MVSSAGPRPEGLPPPLARGPLASGLGSGLKGWPGLAVVQVAGMSPGPGGRWGGSKVAWWGHLTSQVAPGTTLCPSLFPKGRGGWRPVGGCPGGRPSCPPELATGVCTGDPKGRGPGRPLTPDGEAVLRAGWRQARAGDVTQSGALPAWQTRSWPVRPEAPPGWSTRAFSLDGCGHPAPRARLHREAGRQGRPRAACGCGADRPERTAPGGPRSTDPSRAVGSPAAGASAQAAAASALASALALGVLAAQGGAWEVRPLGFPAGHTSPRGP